MDAGSHDNLAVLTPTTASREYSARPLEGTKLRSGWVPVGKTFKGMTDEMLLRFARVVRDRPDTSPDEADTHLCSSRTRS